MNGEITMTTYRPRRPLARLQIPETRQDLECYIDHLGRACVLCPQTGNVWSIDWQALAEMAVDAGVHLAPEGRRHAG